MVLSSNLIPLTGLLLGRPQPPDGSVILTISLLIAKHRLLLKSIWLLKFHNLKRFYTCWAILSRFHSPLGCIITSPSTSLSISEIIITWHLLLTWWLGNGSLLILIAPPFWNSIRPALCISSNNLLKDMQCSTLSSGDWTMIYVFLVC